MNRRENRFDSFWFCSNTNITIGIHGHDQHGMHTVCIHTTHITNRSADRQIKLDIQEMFESVCDAMCVTNHINNKELETQNILIKTYRLYNISLARDRIQYF